MVTSGVSKMKKFKKYFISTLKIFYSQIKNTLLNRFLVYLSCGFMYLLIRTIATTATMLTKKAV